MSHTESQKAYRRDRRDTNKCYLLDFCEKHRFEMESLTEYQTRINDKVDIYPTSKKYFVLSIRKWGGYNNLEELIKYIK